MQLGAQTGQYPATQTPGLGSNVTTFSSQETPGLGQAEFQGIPMELTGQMRPPRSQSIPPNIPGGAMYAAQRAQSLSRYTTHTPRPFAQQGMYMAPFTINPFDPLFPSVGADPLIHFFMTLLHRDLAPHPCS